ncbi:ceramidase [Obelidium mucronatum]|nr:ceramidase [Obelidium mucronatum]
MNYNLTGTEGFWSPVTSTKDWCEENYAISPYIVEFFNSISCIGYIFGMLAGLWSIRGGAVDSAYIVGFCSIGIMGLGSFMFHASLKYEMQLMDEIPMLLSVCIQLYTTLMIRPMDRQTATWIHTILVLYFAVAVVCHVLVTAPEVFAGLFAIIPVLFVLYAPFQTRAFLRDPLLMTHKRNLWQLYGLICAVFVIAVSVWSLDNHLCFKLQEARRHIGYPIGIVTELHMWWHFLTALAAYCTSLRAMYMRLLIEGYSVNLRWIFIFPWLTKVEQKYDNDQV